VTRFCPPWLLLAVLAGCSGAPAGHERVRAIANPRGRPVAVIPFSCKKPKAFTADDALMLAEFTARDIRRALPNETIHGPTAMRDALKTTPDESRWTEIGRETGAQLLLVGDILLFDIVDDTDLGSRQAFVDIRFRVLDVSVFPPKTIVKESSWYLTFPEEPEDRTGKRYVSMDLSAFRTEFLRYAAKRLGGIFYDHLEKKLPVNQLQIRWRVED